MSRSNILSRIERACANAQAPELPQTLPDFPDYDDPVAKFREELEGVSGVFFDARPSGSLADCLAAILEKEQAGEIYWESEEMFAKHQIEYRLRNPEAFKVGHLVYSIHFEARIDLPLVLHSKPYERKILADAAISVSSALCGVAETGTVVHQVGERRGRLLPVLPPAHIMLLSEKDLLMNHAEFFSSVHPGQNGSAITLITGPSRTADIEKTLVLGVHGPHRWYVVLTV